jgi:hypothetical protein
MAVSNTVTYETTYEDVLQDRLDHPTTWKEMCDVAISDTRIVSSSYWSVTPTPQSVTRGSTVQLQTFSEVADTLTISTGKDLGIFVDWADLAQSPWTKPTEIFDRIGALLNEYIEAQVLAQHASWTNFGSEDLNADTAGGGTTQITVTASVIDDVIRGAKRVIRKNNGQTLMKQYGVGFVWRAADFEVLEAFVQANGFSTADQALMEGTVEGLRYLGVDHYWSNDNTANHLMAGVKKVQRLGILRGTYGRAHTIDFPASSGEDGFLSGEAFYSRVDIGHMTPTSLVGTVLDINVA